MDMMGKPASFVKRLSSVFIDVILIAFLYIGIASITIKIADNVVHYNDLIAEANTCLEEYYSSAVDEGLITYDEENDQYILVEGITEESQQYIDFMNSEKVLKLQETYGKVKQQIKTIELVKFTIDIFIPELIFMLIIPLFRKDNATVGKFLFKLSVVNKGDYRASKLQIIFRFTVLYLLETLFFYYFFDVFALIALPLIEIGVYSFTKHKLSIHDYLVGTKVVENESSVIFDTIEEKNSYYEQKAINDEIYAKQREESRKKTHIDMEGYND